MNEPKKELLIIDDQPGVRKLLKEVLSLEGYLVNMAGNGIQAMELISSASPDLILLDVKMPGMSGLELLKILRETDTQVGIIMMTACIEQEIIEATRKYGVEHFISKPFDLNEVRNIINQVLEDKSRLLV